VLEWTGQSVMVSGQAVIVLVRVSTIVDVVRRGGDPPEPEPEPEPPWWPEPEPLLFPEPLL
jgi:hypothetical protein